MDRTNGYRTRLRRSYFPLMLARVDWLSGRIICRFLELFPDRAPRSSRTGPHGYHTRRPHLPNANDA